MLFPKGYTEPTSPIDVSKLTINDTWQTDESFIETHRTILETHTKLDGSKITIEWYQGKIDCPNGDYKWVSGHRVVLTPYHGERPNVNFNVEVAWYSEYRGVTHNVDKDTYYEFHIDSDGKVISQCDASKYGNPNNRHVKAVMAELSRRKQKLDEF